MLFCNLSHTRMNDIVSNDVSPQDVRRILSEHLLVGGMKPLVLDMQRSRGVHLRDAATGKEYLDFFGFFATSVLGMNHPALVEDADFRERLLEAALHKVTNSDIATMHLARFARTFGRVATPEYLPYSFFISGGAAAVENALKAAFDWKVRKNRAKGRRGELGKQVLHLEQAFHGRSGYTLSLTNTADPNKIRHFPLFDWPRIPNPKIVHPLDAHLEEVERAEAAALNRAKEHFQAYGDDIASVIIEPIQGEGGDNHFRPEFLVRLKELAHENDALLIFDEVQTGIGLTGRFWAHQALGVRPDLIAFGKKTQVCGVLAGPKMDEVEDHVFRLPGRINSTWGGNLADMVRFDRILEVMEEQDIVDQVDGLGAHLLMRLQELAAAHACVGNVRGRGLMCAFDLPDSAVRAAFLETCYEGGLVMLGCGSSSVRFRPPLIVTTDELDEGIDLIDSALRRIGM